MEQISLRRIQRYLYCPHRWGLCEIEQLWADNLFVAKADLMHERVHNADYGRTARGIKAFFGVRVYHDSPEYNLYGVTDCIEARKDSNGVTLVGESGRYQLCIVEYKPTKPKSKDWYEEDLMQVFAQKICTDHIFGCDCEAVMYYGDVRKRFSLPVREEYDRLDRELKAILAQMRDALTKGQVPPIPKGQRCNGCSMKDICIPTKKTKSQLRASIQELIDGEL